VTRTVDGETTVIYKSSDKNNIWEKEKYIKS
jgi:hypothetical protein